MLGCAPLLLSFFCHSLYDLVCCGMNVVCCWLFVLRWLVVVWCGLFATWCLVVDSVMSVDCCL